MKNSKPGRFYFIDGTQERPEILEVRKRILAALKWPVLTLGLIAAFLGAIQAFQQGRHLFSLIYLSIYGTVFTAFILDRITFSARAMVLVVGLYLYSVAVMIRIGLSGIGLEIMILACLLSAVFWGVRTGLAVIGVSTMAVAGVAAGLISGFLPVHQEHMLNSTSPLAWATTGMVFLMMTVGFVFIPRMFLNRLQESLSLLEDRSQRLQESNLILQKEIEAREKAEEAVREGHKIINRSPAVAFLWINAEGWPIEYVSDNVEKMLGYKAEDFTSGAITYAEIIHPEDLEKLREKDRKFLEDSWGKDFFLSRYRVFAKDGSIKWLDHMTFLRRDGEGTITHYDGIVSDITEHIKAEDEKAVLQSKLQRSQKMESLGLLAGGVAHDLNNVLSGIVSYPELLLLDLPEDSKFRKPIETMQQSGHRATAIVQDLLTVARGVAMTKEPLNLNDAVRDYLDSPEFKKLLQFHPAVTITSTLDPNLLNICGSPIHIRKIIMNMVSNASEAIEGNGTVAIATENRYIDRPLKGYDHVTIGEYAVLSVSDDGSGISSGDLERIFEPFYTKKVMGRSGTGLGLAVVWHVTQDHEGYIDVKSSENGSTFEVYIPITRDELSKTISTIPMSDLTGNGETILVVDDVESQREISCTMLNKLGYKPIAVSSGEEAVEYLTENTVDLLVLDMIMDPGINGRETFERIRRIHPKQKATIVSGFAQTDEVRAAQTLGAGHYIKKPLTLQSLGLAVKEELKNQR